MKQELRCRNNGNEGNEGDEGDEGNEGAGGASAGAPPHRSLEYESCRLRKLRLCRPVLPIACARAIMHATHSSSRHHDRSTVHAYGSCH